MQPEQEEKVHKNILDKIRSGKITMRSRAFWQWRSVLWALAIGLLAAAAIFAVSFVLFITRANGIWDLPQFGLHGIREFLIFFPILFIPAMALFLWLIERFARQHSSAYRVPIIYSILGIVVAVLVASFVVYRTPLHYQLFRSAIRQQMPGGRVYQFFRSVRPDDLYIGSVLTAQPNRYGIQTPEGFLVTIVANNQTQIVVNSPIVVGDFIEAIGQEQHGEVMAQNIKKIDPDSLYPLRHRSENFPPPMK